MQLYNLRDDIGEKSNVPSANPEVVTNLVKLLEKYVADGRSTAGPRQTNDVRVDIWREIGMAPPVRSGASADRR